VCLICFAFGSQTKGKIVIVIIKSKVYDVKKIHMKSFNGLLINNRNVPSFCSVILKSYCYVTNKKRTVACVDVNKLVLSPKTAWYCSSLQPSAQSKKQTNRLIYINKGFNKAQLRALLQWAFQTLGPKQTVDLVEQLKHTGYEYATRAGISLAIDDLQIPPTKSVFLTTTQKALQSAYEEVEQGNLTSLEYSSQIIERWNATSEALKQEVIVHFKSKDILNPVYMMAFSGARGNISQVRQLTGMRGLMADPTGRIIEFPIQSNFREGLTLTEYLISCYGARKGVVDTALRTATSGYLTRRLVDAAHHVTVRIEDCGTKKGIVLSELRFGSKGVYGLNKRLVGRVLAKSVYHNGIKLASSNQSIPMVLANQLSQLQQPILVRSPMTCEQSRFICQHCYGWNLATSALVSIGESVGVIAAQSIGEPGTQLTMRTFHTGGVFSGNVAEELKSPVFGQVHFPSSIPGCCVRTTRGQIAFLTKQTACFFLCDVLTKKPLYTIKLPSYSLLFVKQGQQITTNYVIAELFVTQKLAQNQSRTIFQTLYSNTSGELRFPMNEMLQALPKTKNISQTYYPTAPVTLERNNFWILASHQQRFLTRLAPDLVQPGDLIDINAPLSGYEQTTPLHRSPSQPCLGLPITKKKINWQSKSMPTGEWFHYYAFFQWKTKQKQTHFSQKSPFIRKTGSAKINSKGKKINPKRKKTNPKLKSLFACFTMIQAVVSPSTVTEKKKRSKTNRGCFNYSQANSASLKPTYNTFINFKPFDSVYTNPIYCVGLSPTPLCQLYAFNETKRHLLISFSHVQRRLQIQLFASFFKLNIVINHKQLRLNALKANTSTVYQSEKPKQTGNSQLLFFTKWLHRFEVAWQLNSVIACVDLKILRNNLFQKLANKYSLNKQLSTKYQLWFWTELMVYECAKSMSSKLKANHFKNQQNARQTLHIHWPMQQQFKLTQTIEPLMFCVQRKPPHLTTVRQLNASAWLSFEPTKNDTSSLLEHSTKKAKNKNKPQLTSKKKVKNKLKLQNKTKTIKTQNRNLFKTQPQPMKHMKNKKKKTSNTKEQKIQPNRNQKIQYAQTIQSRFKKFKTKPAKLAKPAKSTINNKTKFNILQKKQPKPNQKVIFLQQKTLIKQFINWQIYQICQNRTPNMCVYFFMCNYITYETELQRFSIWLKWYKQQKNVHDQLGLTRNHIQIPSTTSILSFLNKKEDLYNINYVDFPWLNSCVKNPNKSKPMVKTRLRLLEGITKQNPETLQHIKFYDPSLAHQRFKKQIYFGSHKIKLFAHSNLYKTHPKEGSFFLNTTFCSNQTYGSIKKNQYQLRLKSDWLMAKSNSWLDFIQICPWFGFIQKQDKPLLWFSQTQRRLQTARQTIKTNLTACNNNFVYLSARMLLSSCIKNTRNKFLTDYGSIDLVRAQSTGQQPGTSLICFDHRSFKSTINAKQPRDSVTITHLTRFYGWLQVISYAEVCTDNHNKIGLEGQSVFDQHMVLKRCFSQRKTPFYKATYDDSWLIWSKQLQKKLLCFDFTRTHLYSKTPVFIPYLSGLFKQFIQNPFKLTQLTSSIDFDFSASTLSSVCSTKAKSKPKEIWGNFYASVFDFYAHTICLKKKAVFWSELNKNSWAIVKSKATRITNKIKQTNNPWLGKTINRLQKKFENVNFYYRLSFLKHATLPYVQTSQHVVQHVECMISDLRPIILKPNQIYWNALSRYKPSLLADELCFKANQKTQPHAVSSIQQTQCGLPMIQQLPILPKQSNNEKDQPGYFYSLTVSSYKNLKNGHLQILFRQKAIFQVVQKATQLYTVFPNQNKTTDFLSSLTRSLQPYPLLTNKFQLAKSGKKDDPFYSPSFSAKLSSKSMGLNKVNRSIEWGLNKKPFGSTKPASIQAKSGAAGFSSSEKKNPKLKKKQKATFAKSKAVIKAKTIKKHFLFQSPLFWVHFRSMCVKEKRQMIKTYLPFKHSCTPRLIGLTGFIPNQNFKVLKHCFICSNDAFAFVRRPSLSSFAFGSQRQNKPMAKVPQTNTQMFLNRLIQLKPILKQVAEQKKTPIWSKKTISNTFKTRVKKFVLNKLILNKTTLNKKNLKIKGKNKGIQITKKQIRKQLTLNKRITTPYIVCSKTQNLSAFKQVYGFIKYQVMFKPFVCFGLPLDNQPMFGSQYHIAPIAFSKKLCVDRLQANNVLKSLMIQPRETLKRWFATSLGVLSPLSGPGLSNLIVSTKKGELISVSDRFIHTSSLASYENKPILTHYHKVSFYQTQPQINYDSKPMAECTYLTNEDLQSYVLPKFLSKPKMGSVGQYLPAGVAFFDQAGFSEPGQVLFLNKSKVVIRRAKSFLLTAGATLQLPYGQFIPKNSPLVTFSYKQVVADDIIQGIPKIDRLFEARGIQPGITLAKLLKQQFNTFCALYLNQADPDFSASATKITIEFIQHYTLDAIQNVYQSQGVIISDKHLEIIIKQMTSKVLINDPKNSGFLKGDLVDFYWMNQANAFAKPEQRIQYEPVVLGITQSSLQTDGFISAASFQETINVLTKAAYFRTTDFLGGLKENVILGHLIPVGTGIRF
jgi:hypothetical protein